MGFSLSIKPNRMIKNMWYIFLLVLLWIVFAFATDGPDYGTYENWYTKMQIYGSVEKRFEAGYTWLMSICAKIGLNYQQFLMVLSGIGLTLIGISLKQYCRYPSIALILYAFYPFVFDIVQIRNFLSFAIVFFALRYLKEFSVMNFIIYFFLCCVAMLFHKTAGFYFLFVFCYAKDYKRVLCVTLMICLLLVTSSIIANSFLNNLIAKFGSEGYLEGGSTLKKILGYGLFSIIATMAMYSSHGERDYLLTAKDDYSYLRQLIPILLLTCVAISFTLQAYRFFRSMSLIVYVVFLNNGLTFFSNGTIKGETKNFCNTCFAFLFSLFFYARQISPISAMYETLTKVVIESNIVFFGK